MGMQNIICSTEGETLEKLLHDIRQTETHADMLVAEMKEKASQFLLKGKTDAEAFLAERKQTLLAEKTAALTSRKKELEKEQQKYVKKAEKQADYLASSVAQHKKKALALLVQDFKRLLKEEQ